jgi:hypothetical protein
VKRKEMVDGLCELDMIAKERPLNEDERLRKEDISRELERSVLLEEGSWRQKSRALWLREGDKNTKFFHRLANSYGRHNLVESLVVNGNMTSDSAEIKEHIVNMKSDSFQLMRMKEIGWKGNLRRVKCWRW